MSDHKLIISHPSASQKIWKPLYTEAGLLGALMLAGTVMGGTLILLALYLFNQGRPTSAILLVVPILIVGALVSAVSSSLAGSTASIVFYKTKYLLTIPSDDMLAKWLESRTEGFGLQLDPDVAQWCETVLGYQPQVRILCATLDHQPVFIGFKRPNDPLMFLMRWSGEHE